MSLLTFLVACLRLMCILGCMKCNWSVYCVVLVGGGKWGSCTLSCLLSTRLCAFCVLSCIPKDISFCLFLHSCEISFFLWSCVCYECILFVPVTSWLRDVSVSFLFVSLLLFVLKDHAFCLQICEVRVTSLTAVWKTGIVFIAAREVVRSVLLANLFRISPHC
jgi:hypothetical protein